MQRLEVEHLRLQTRIKKPLQYLIIHAFRVHLKDMGALTMKHLHQGTDGNRIYFDLANVLRIGAKSAVVLSYKARRRRGVRTKHVKFYHAIALCHRSID